MQLLAFMVALFAAVVQPQDPNARVHDFAGVLSADQRTQLEQLSRDVERKTTAQIVVVTVNSLDGQTVDAYAHELLSAWGIGKQKYNNGVLLLVAPNEKRMRFEVGYGVEPLLTDTLCGEIADRNIVPHFQQGNFGLGILEGTRQAAAVLIADPAGARGDPNSGPVLARTARRRTLSATGGVAAAALVMLVLSVLAVKRRLYSTTSFALVTTVVVLLVIVAAYLLWRTPQTQQPLALFGGATAAAVGAWGVTFSKYRRFGPHGCSKCGTQLELLSEQEEDPKLSSVQQLEEKIGSVDYDVWICPACLNQDTERYIQQFSGFEDCSKCHARAFKEDPQRTTRQATTTHSGIAYIDGCCIACQYKTSRQILLPIISVPVVSTSSGNGSFGGGGGFSSGGGGGGGGFGGGSSGGGGASRGW